MLVYKAKDLTQEQRKEFSEVFYEMSEIDDRETPAPWGCPWEYCPERELFGDDIAEMAYVYFDEVKEEMALESITDEE